MRARYARQIRAGIVAARNGEQWSSDWEPLTTEAFIRWHTWKPDYRAKMHVNCRCARD